MISAADSGHTSVMPSCQNRRRLLNRARGFVYHLQLGGSIGVRYGTV